MRTWLPTHPTKLSLEALEAREVPAVTILFDYTFDSKANGGAGFFESHPEAVAILNQVGAEHGARLSASLGEIAPGGGNSWTASLFDPRTGAMTTIDNLSVPANTIRVYVGARDLGAQAGVGGYGGFSAGGTQAWLNYLNSRGHNGFGPWGGSLAFGTTTNWFYGSTTSGIGSSQVDFYSVALHELGHLLGIGTAPQWTSLVSGGSFVGPNAQAVYGGPVPLHDGAHWADGVMVNGQNVSLDPFLTTGTRVSWSSLDAAALTDIGWGNGGGNTPVTPPVVPPPPPVVQIAPVPIGSPLLDTTNGSTRLIVATGPADGTAQVFSQDSNGALTAAGPRFNPFPGFGGVIRSVVADFNGDGKADFAFGTGAGTNAQVRVISGATGTDLLGPSQVLNGFSGGVFLAAGDVDRDGAAELAVSADAGGGTRVSLFKVSASTGLTAKADFLAYGDANFRGGSRVALGDVNRDGAADLIVGAGIGGAPRVAVYDGNSVMTGTPRSVVPDFYALDSNLRSGVFVSTADLDGDGYSDVIYSTGNTGGPRVRILGGQTLTANPGRDAQFLAPMADFFAFDPNDRSGIRIATRDLNADGKSELVVATGAKTGGLVRVLTLADLKSPGSMTAAYQQPFGNPATIDGIYVG